MKINLHNIMHLYFYTILQLLVAIHVGFHKYSLSFYIFKN